MIITAALTAAPASLTVADTWDNNNLSGTGAWSTAVNWADDTEPTAADDVTLPAVIPGNGIIDLAVGELAQSLTINNNYTLTNTLSGTLDIAGTGGNVTVASGVTGTLNTALVGATGLTKLGTGTLILDGDNAAAGFSGKVVIQSGTIRASADNRWGAIPGSPVADAITLSGGTLQASASYELNAARGITITGAGGRIYVNAQQFTYASTIAGTGSLTTDGIGSLHLNHANSFSGGLIVNGGIADGGILYLNDDNAAGTGPITLYTLTLGLTPSLRSNLPVTTLANPIQTVNGGSIDPIAGRTIVLNGTISGTVLYVGFDTPTGIAGGTLVVNSDNGGWEGHLTHVKGILSAGHKNAFGVSLVRLAQADSSFVPEIQASIANLTGADAISTPVLLSSSGVNRRTLGIGGSIDFDLSGVISGDSGIKLLKTGSNTISLLNSGNTYPGDTIIEDGMLAISSNGNLGKVTNKINFTGGMLKTTAGVTSTRLITTSGAGGTIDTNGFDSTFGSVDGTESGGFTKIAAGKLTLPHVRLAGSVGSGLAVNGGTLAIAPNGQAAGVSVVNTLAVATGAVMDITDNHLIVKSTPVGSQTGGIYDGVQGLVQSGRNGGAWNGTTGIITSQSAAQGTLTTLGVSTGAIARLLTGTNTTIWAGQTINAASTMVMYTYTGDANLDGLIDGTDYFYIDNSVGTSADGYGNGDFNYDGIVDGTDYFYIDSNIVDQGTPFFAGSEAEILAVAVPEPAGAVGLLLMGLPGALRRRRHHALAVGKSVFTS